MISNTMSIVRCSSFARSKNVGYFLYDHYLFGAVSFLDLFTFFPKSIIEIIFTLGLLLAIIRTLGKNYLV